MYRKKESTNNPGILTLKPIHQPFNFLLILLLFNGLLKNIQIRASSRITQFTLGLHRKAKV